MNVERIPVKKRHRIFREMLEKVYENDPTYKNNKEGIFNLVCNPSKDFYKRSLQEMVVVSDKGNNLCMAVAIIHEERPEVVCMAFFEAMESSVKAVKQLVETITEFGKSQGCEQLIVGLEGHCNYGIGFLVASDSKEKKTFPSFGEAYCPSYYATLLEKAVKEYTPRHYRSFFDSVTMVEQRVEKYMLQFSTLQKNYTLEKSSFLGKGFYSTMQRYTDLNNLIFKGHTSYFHRDYKEDLELFQSMAPLLNTDNLLFIRYKGKDIGFILWYPDFNELVSRKKGASIETFIRYRILMQRPKTLKIVEIGVDPKYRSTPAILFLFNAVVEANKEKAHLWKKTNSYSRLISSWIDSDNLPSIHITQKFLKQSHKEFITYEKSLKG